MPEDVKKLGLSAAVAHLETLGWKRHGVTLAKGESRVTLTFSGVMEVAGTGPVPAELLGDAMLVRRLAIDECVWQHRGAAEAAALCGNDDKARWHQYWADQFVALSLASPVALHSERNAPMNANADRIQDLLRRIAAETGGIPYVPARLLTEATEMIEVLAARLGLLGPPATPNNGGKP